jgi:flagella basal body P-ring formation protein FlgA
MRCKVITALLLLFYAAGAAAYDPAVILKKNRVQVSRDKICLGDIADFSGINSADADGLASLYIKRAALPGYSVTVTRETVENQVRKEFRYIKVTGPESVTVYTEKGTVAGDALIDIAKKYILENMPWKKEDVAIETKGGRGSIDIMNGEVLLRVKEEGKTEFRGNVVVPVEITVDGKFYKIEPVPLFVRVNTGCLVSSDDIRIREPLSGRYRIEKKDITFLPRGILTDEAQAANKAAKRPIAKGTILLDSMFEKEPLFRRGAPVNVAVRIKGISVETTGTALDEGREGDTARVKLLNGKMVQGRVSGDGKVIIQK